MFLLYNFNLITIVSSIPLLAQLSKWAHSDRNPRKLNTLTTDNLINFRSLSRTCAVTIMSIFIGWRIYMEDAHLSIAPFSDKKIGLFGVFDGHGGNFRFMQEHSVRLSSKGISLLN